MQLRPYQQSMVDAVFDYLFEENGNPIVAAPGGVGKSLAMNAIIRKAVVDYPGTRVISLVHDQKIISQNVNSMLAYWPNAPVGVYSSGLRSRDTLEPILYCGIQSVAKRPQEFGLIHIVIVDEADMVSPNENTLYQKFIMALKEVNPKLRVIGFTATSYRLGIGCMTNLDLWDRVVLDMTKTEKFNWFIENDYLSPLVNKKACVEIDITNIAMKAGEFDEKAMQEAADDEKLHKAVVSECIKYGSDRNHWLIFSAGVKNGHKLCKLFNSKGVSAVMLSGEDSIEVREAAEKDFRDGKYKALVNCGLYSRGWDFPSLDLIAVVRATQSTGWWIQTLLRGTRKADGKTNCAVLDFGGNTRRLGQVNNPVIPQPRRKGDGEKGEAPVKICPECFSYLHTRTMICPDCGFKFPPPKSIEHKASDQEIMKWSKPDEPIIEEYPVIGIRYACKLTKTNQYYLRVSYFTGPETFKENLFFDNPNALTKKRLENWWTHRHGKFPIPEGSDEACERAQTELHIPSLIRVNTASKWRDVVGAEFEETDNDNEPF